jgi:hypothetical protein
MALTTSTGQVTTKKVTHLYGPPVVGEDAKLTNMTVPAIDPREGTIPQSLFRLAAFLNETLSDHEIVMEPGSTAGAR